MEKHIDTLNFEDVTISEFITEIKEAIENKEYGQPILGLGKAGIGKSECIQEIAQELNIGFKAVRLADHAVQDLTGYPIPYRDEQLKKSIVEMSDNVVFPIVGKDPEEGILLLDEFPSAEKDVRTAALQLLDANRGMGSYKLPDKWLVVVLGNGPQDGGTFNGLEDTVITRCEDFRINPSFNDWKTWALKHDINDTVLAFIENNGKNEVLHTMLSSEQRELDADETKDTGRACATPRSWTALSRKLNVREARLGILPKEKVERHAGGFLGAELGAKFAAFYANKKFIIPYADIASGKALSLNLDNYKPESLYILMGNIRKNTADKLNSYTNDQIKTLDGNDLKEIANVTKFIIKMANEKQFDYASIMVSDITAASNSKFVGLVIDNDKFSTACPEFMKFLLDNKDNIKVFGDIARKMSERIA